VDFEDLAISIACDDFAGSGILAEAGLRNAILSSYNLNGQVPAGPFTYGYDELTTGGFGFTETEFRGQAVDRGSEIRIAHEAAAPARIDLLWRGKIRASAAYPLARVDVESMAAVGISGLDADIPGTPPTDPAALEAARRTALLARFKAVANDPDALDDGAIEQLLRDSEAGSVSDLMALDGGAARFSELVLSLTEIPGSSTARAQDFPVACAILMRDVSLPANTLSSLLQATRAVLARLDQAGFAPRAAADLPAGRACAVWTVDAAWFDQNGWPGTGPNPTALRNSRIARAGAWLARQGIALNPVTLP
jgi:hypothetical protein